MDQGSGTEPADPGASETFPMPASQLRKHGQVVLKGRPCTITELSTGEQGGQAQVKIVGVDVFTGATYQHEVPATDTVDVPHVSRNEYQLVNIDGGFLNLMANDGTERDDIGLPDGDLGASIQSQFNDTADLVIIVVSAMGEDAAISVKEA